jgi:hypothetical protein
MRVSFIYGGFPKFPTGFPTAQSVLIVGPQKNPVGISSNFYKTLECRSWRLASSYCSCIHHISAKSLMIYAGDARAYLGSYYFKALFFVAPVVNHVLPPGFAPRNQKLFCTWLYSKACIDYKFFLDRVVICYLCAS